MLGEKHLCKNGTDTYFSSFVSFFFGLTLATVSKTA